VFVPALFRILFFYRKGDTTIMIDAGYNYGRLEEKMGWLGIDPSSIRHILITHQDTDHVGAVEADSLGLFRKAKLYVGETENRYLTGEVRRKVIYHLYKLPQVTIRNEKVLLHDGEAFESSTASASSASSFPATPGARHGLSHQREVSVYGRYDLARSGRRLQLHLRAGGG